MPWYVIFFIIGIITAVVGIWNLAQRRNLILAIVGIVWFVITLFNFLAKTAGFTLFGYQIIPGLSIDDLLLYIVVPCLIIIAFFQRGTRS